MATKLNASEQSARVETGASGGANLRRSDRVSLELPIEIGGSDARGVVFFEPARTVIISRHGAKIICRRILSPTQEIMMTCKTTGIESAARVVGALGKSEQGYFYGVALLDDEADLWEIDFPELTESEKAEARVLLGCASCGARKVTYLNGFEAEVLEAHHRLSFYCTRCVDATIWWRVSARPADPSEPLSATRLQPNLPPGRSKDERREVRTQLHLPVCLRHPQLGEEIAETTGISRGGFGFKSRKFYTSETILEAALPYAPGQANIFCAVEVQHCERLEDEELFACGVSYVQVHRGWPKK
jgi:hypothetical protein